MYEFEKNKANNLILYGINTKHPETSDSLKNRISNVFRDHLNIRREITIQKASRVHTGKMNILIASGQVAMWRYRYFRFNSFIIFDLKFNRA